QWFIALVRACQPTSETGEWRKFEPEFRGTCDALNIGNSRGFGRRGPNERSRCGRRSGLGARTTPKQEQNSKHQHPTTREAPNINLECNRPATFMFGHYAQLLEERLSLAFVVP